MGTKICSSCKKEKSLDFFGKHSARKDGYQYYCIECRRKEGKEYYSKHREKRCEHNRKYWATHPSEVHASAKKWRDSNIEYERNRHRGQYKKNPEKYRDAMRRWRQENPEKEKEKRNKYYLSNPERGRGYTKKWKEKHPEAAILQSVNRRAKIKEVGGTIRKGEWVSLKEKYGNKCLCCGRTDVSLTVDHVIPICLNGKNIIENIQPLCKKCNCRKGKNIIDYRPKEIKGD